MSSKQDIDQELENEYNNSLTAKDMPEDIVVPTYIKQWTEKMGEAKKTFDVELDISYGQEERSKLDIFRTKETPQNAPVFIFIHGGYWRLCSKEDCGPPVFPAIRAASFAVLLEYQLAPKATMDEIVAQTKSGVEFVGKRFPESPIYLCGHSAGGHLAAMMMIQQSWEDPDLPKRVKGICLVSGLFDLLPILKTTNNIALKLNEESAKRNSPALQLKLVQPSIKCPVILPVGEYESVSFHNQSKNMFEVLKSHGIEAKYFNIPQCDHFNIISHLTNPEFQLSKEVHQMLTEKHNK